jgi:uncharacterized delta-60 repeat protein
MSAIFPELAGQPVLAKMLQMPEPTGLGRNFSERARLNGQTTADSAVIPDNTRELETMSRMRQLLVMMAALCVGLAAIAGGATAKPAKPSKTQKVAGGTLDSTFGQGGKVTMAFPAENAGSTGPKYTLPFEFTPGHLAMAQAPGNKTVIAGATKIVRYLANGKLDPSFGQGGTVTVPRPSGTVFVLAGVAVDSHGRVVLAGLTRPLPTNSTPDPVLSSAAVLRFNANGTPDTSFANGGTLITNFGLDAPKATGETYPGTSVGLRDVVIDSQNRPVVTGAYLTEIGTGRESAKSTGFVARLTENGALDPSFGDQGMRSISTLTSLGQIVSHAGGYLALSTASERPRNAITALDENGNIDSTFGSFGFRTLPFNEAPAATVAPSGKILLLGRPERSSTYKKEKVKDKKTGKTKVEKVRVRIYVQTVQRLLPSGAADPGFGRVGRVRYTDPAAGSLSALTADQNERIYLVGRIGTRISKSPNNPLHRTQFLIERTQANGNYDKSFGKNGIVTTGFGGPTDAFATQVALDAKGRVLVGGGITSPELESGGGYALARYLP